MATDKPAAAVELTTGELTERRRIGAALLLGAGPNTFQDLNLLLESERIEKIYHDKGMTLPASVLSLRFDAQQKIQHSAILGNNIESATGSAKPGGAASHHIVAKGAQRAEPSRRLLYGWGISINDADNGVYLRSSRSVSIKNLNKATAHSILHTRRYHLAVYNRLGSITQFRASKIATMPQGRAALKAINSLIMTNKFPY